LGASPGAGATAGDSQAVAPEEYREVLAEMLGEAARQGRIPRTFKAHSRALVVDFTRLTEAGWYVHKLARSDSRTWWAAVQPFPPHFPGIMPEFGAAIGELRALHRVTDVEIRAATALHRLRLRLFGPITPADMPQHRADVRIREHDCA
jgi:hypothetical protein